MTVHFPAVLPLAIVAGAMVLTAAACGAGGETPASSSPATPGRSSGGSGTSATPSATASGTPSAGAASAGCAVGNLRIRYADEVGSAGAGSVSGTFTFTNTGTTRCTLAGFPGVSYVSGGTQVGQAATRTDDAVRTRTLAPQQSVRAALRRTQPRGYGEECRETEVDGFRVFPPGSTEPALVAFPTTGCASTSAPLLQVGPVR